MIRGISETLLHYTGLLLLVTITLFHYITPTTLPPVHELLKAFYFLPILIFAHLYGLKGGLLSASAVIFLYMPHVMFQWGGGFLANISRFMMMVLYLVIGSLTGYLWQNERRERNSYKETFEKLQKAFKQLEQSTAEKEVIENQLRSAERLSTLGELTASLAHEVRNPLASIKGVAEILRDEPDSANNAKFIHILMEETNRLDSVVSNYLSYSKPGDANQSNISMKSMLNSTIMLLGNQFRKKHVSVDIQPGDADYLIFCNESQTRQALLNILLNSLQAVPENGIILIFMAEKEHSLLMTIQDNGPGFDDSTLSALFKPFYTTKPNGAGLGLAITKRIMENQGGVITAYNSPEHHAIISLEFKKKNAHK